MNVARLVYGPFRCCLALAAGLVVIACEQAGAQSLDPGDTVSLGVKLSGQIRHRLELDRRMHRDDQTKAFADYHLLRSRAKLTYRPSADVDALVQVQDSRFFGQETGTLDGSAQALDLHQAWFAIRDLWGSDVDLQVGRQELVYGNERLIGSVGWSNVGRSFDAVRASMEKTWGTVDLFASRLRGTTGPDASRNFYGLYGTVKLAEKHKGDFFALLDNNTSEIASGPDSGSIALSRFTAGTYLRGNVSKIAYEAEFAYQGGEAGDTNGVSTIAATLLSGSVAYQGDRAKAGILYTRLSGDDDAADDKSKAFNTLFATNHKFYGFMDYFPVNVQGAGLQDVALQTSYKVSKKVVAKLDAHLFMTAVKIVDENALGKEIDATVNYKYNGVVSFTAGASVFLADALMEGVVGDDLGWWGYLMTTVAL